MFQPVIPIGGYAGWSFLNRTMDSQRAALESSGTMQRDLDYFTQNISRIQTAEALVADRRLLSVALGAFGLDTDIDNRFFIEKVLSDGTLEPKALANRLSDKSYLKLAQAFGFGDLPVPNTVRSDFAETITSAYKTRQFEIAVGQQDDTMRLALNLSRELGELAQKTSSEDTKWYSVMGSEPLRAVFETVFGLPDSFAALDIDKQLTVFKDKADRAFGDSGISQFSDPGTMDELVRVFLARAQLEQVQQALTPGQTALTLLQSAG